MFYQPGSIAVSPARQKAVERRARPVGTSSGRVYPSIALMGNAILPTVVDEALRRGFPYLVFSSTSGLTTLIGLPAA